MNVRPRLRTTLIRTASVLLSILLFASLLLGAELIVRWIKPRPLQLGFRDEVAAPDSSANSPFHIPVNEPPRLDKPWPPNRRPPGTGVTRWEPIIYENVTGLGIWTRPSVRTRSVNQAASGEVLYDATYTIDSEKRRVTPWSQGQGVIGNLLFLGCSFTFGEGLEDDQTLPAHAARLQQGHRVYNYSFPGWGPANLLRMTERPEFGRDLPSRPGTAVYVFIRSHVSRALGTLGIYRRVRNWAKSLPRYELQEDGTLLSDGMLSDRAMDPWLRFFSGSSLLEWLGVDFPIRLEDRHFDTFAGILKALRDNLRRRAGVRDFYVVLYPQRDTEEIIPILERAGIHYLDYSKWYVGNYTEGPFELRDGHPSAQINRFLARQILTDLKLLKH